MRPVTWRFGGNALFTRTQSCGTEGIKHIDKSYRGIPIGPSYLDIERQILLRLSQVKRQSTVRNDRAVQW